MKISDIFEKAYVRQILDSRGNPTIEFELHTYIGRFRSSCPSGASKGSKEALVLIDNSESYYNGKSVKKAIFNVENIIIPRLENLSINICDQKLIDKFLCSLDGSEGKKRFGANSILPISICLAKSGAIAKNIELRQYISHLSGFNIGMPKPHFNVINGGVHSGNKLAFQEIMIVFEHKSISKNLEKGAVFYNHLKETIRKKYGSQATSVGDEGGFNPPVDTLYQALDLIMETYKENKFLNMRIAIDSAASTFYKNGMYFLDDKNFTSDELVDYYLKIIEEYPLIYSIEDPFDENDIESWQKFMEKVNGKIRVVGDDLTVTNTKYIKLAIEKKLCDTLLVKPNQIGTVYETIEAVKMARNSNMHIMVSHRSGETEDHFIADFAVGIGAEYIKAGAPCRGERVSKYNQLLRIEESIRRED